MNDFIYDKDTIILNCYDVDLIHRNIAENIRKDGYDVEAIVSMTRGGLVSAAHLAYILGVHPIISIQIGRPPTANSLNHTEYIPMLISDSSDLHRITGKNVLLVDGAIGTGKTIHLATDILDKYKPKDIRVAITTAWSGCPELPSESFWANKTIYLGESFVLWPVLPWEF